MAANAVKIPFTEAAAPSTPASGTVVVYAKADGLIYSKDDAGTETLMSSGAGSGGVATDTIWNAAGDLAVGTGADTAARLAIGAAGGALSRINGAVAWNSGTSNPGSAATGDRYWRTDLGMEIFYDGTRWLTTQIHRVEMKIEDTAPTWPPTTTTTVLHRGIPPYGADYDIYMYDWHLVTSVITTNNGSNYWDTDLRKVNSAGTSTLIGTVATNADTAGNLYNKKLAVNALLGSFVSFFTDATIVAGSPGAFRLHGGHITCRLVIP